MTLMGQKNDLDRVWRAEGDGCVHWKVYSGEIQNRGQFSGADLGTKLLSSVSIPAPPFPVRLRFCPGMTIERLRLCSERP